MMAESGVKVLLKSLLAGVVGSSLFFFFFMMLTVAGMSVAARLTSQPLEAHGVVVTPADFLRRAGLPLSALAFVVVFALAHRRFRRGSKARS